MMGTLILIVVFFWFGNDAVLKGCFECVGFSGLDIIIASYSFIIYKRVKLNMIIIMLHKMKYMLNTLNASTYRVGKSLGTTNLPHGADEDVHPLGPPKIQFLCPPHPSYTAKLAYIHN